MPMIETIELAAGVTLLAVQTEKFKSGCFSFNLMRPHTKRPCYQYRLYDCLGF